MEPEEAFAQAYARRLIAGEDGDRVVAEARGAFALADQRGRAPAAVRAFTPDDAPTSVLETSTSDEPFLVDSVTEELTARGLGVTRVVHPVIGVERGLDGRIARVGHPAELAARESVMHFDLDRRLAPQELAALEDAVRDVLADVHRAVGDFRPMRRALEEAKAWLAADDEAVAAIDWLLDEHLVLLGWQLLDADARPVPGSGLGLLSDEAPRAAPPPAPLPPGVLLAGGRAPERSTVHRRDHFDQLRLRRTGHGDGEARLIGLLTRRAHLAPASRTPVLRRRLERILAAEELIPGTHDHKAAVALYDAFPKPDLLAAGEDDVRATVGALLDLRAGEVRVLTHRAADDRAAWLVVALPRAAATAAFRERLRALAGRAFASDDVEVQEVLGEDDRVQLHVAVYAAPGESLGTPDAEQLQADVATLARTWDDAVADALAAAHGTERGGVLAARWLPRLPDAYRAAVAPTQAAADVTGLERLHTGAPPAVVALSDDGARTRVTVYKRGPKVELAEATRLLEDLGLRVIEEQPFALEAVGEAWVQAFGVLGAGDAMLDLARSGEHVRVALEALLAGETESDSLNRLVISAGVGVFELGVLRAYRRYRQRIGSRYTEGYQNDVIAANPQLTARLLELFALRFDVARPRDEDAEAALKADILEDLDAVALLDHDRILRNQLGLIEATVRTNAYKPDRGALAFKLRGADVPALPQPAPLWEVYVYAPEVEGVHLRGGMLARGGLRWSDRMDYRTEVFGLMRAQVVKNAVIVPAGAKGGFFLRAAPTDPEELREEVRRRYVQYIEALLDLTDDREPDGTIVRPHGVRVLDGDDAYLVVAADKGTATFSDTANAVAVRRGFWLGDAFASGGSAGYDHKALGITARGAWESVTRHFRELGLDPRTDAFTAVGIGDMSGDVFGNGMLLSQTVRLVAAYDHRHVFLDPDPADPAASWRERQRLFDLERSSWDDYDRSLISEGGGVFPRSAKSVPLSPQVRAALGTDADHLPPTDLIAAIIRAPVDLLFNGGIGTVVKASTESHADALDRANDALRADGRELRCRVIGEGGNLGLTQRARIEAARHGVRVHADFIDNSAGVDCSDHEVNLKVLLDLAVRRGVLPVEERDDLLRDVTDDVVAHVLADSFRQARMLAQEGRRSPSRMFAYEDLMDLLEREGALAREADALPSTEAMAERRRAGEGMALPELAVLLAHGKLWLTASLLGSELLDDPGLAQELHAYFPPAVDARFADLVAEHPLRRELLATRVANACVDALGPTWVPGLVTELGADPAEVVRAFRVAAGVLDAEAHWRAVEALDGTVDLDVHWQLKHDADAVVEGVARWQLQHGPEGPVQDAIDAQREGYVAYATALSDLRGGAWAEERGTAAEALQDAGVPTDVARQAAAGRSLLHAGDVVAVAAETDRDVAAVARAFFAVGDGLRLEWLEHQVDALAAPSRLQRWAVRAIRDDLLAARRELGRRALLDAAPGVTPEDAVQAFLDARAAELGRLRAFTRALAAASETDLAGLTLAVRQLRALAA